jgi:TATA-binding protein-associated factor Taf7
MPLKFRVEMDDVEGHMPLRFKEDMTGKEVTVRLEDGTEVRGHALRFKEDTRGDDTEGHMPLRHVELEVDDSQAHLLKTAGEKGEPIYVGFPDGAEVQGHYFRVKEDTTGEDAEGHAYKFREDTKGDDVEGRRIVTPPQSDIP